MGIFHVCPLTNESAALDAAVKAAFQSHDQYPLKAKAGWLLKFDGTSKELGEKLGLGEENNTTNTPCLITSISGYWGRGPSDMWEWLKTRWA